MIRVSPAATLPAHTYWPGLRPTLPNVARSEEHTSELQSQSNIVCRLLLEKKKHGADVCLGVGGYVPDEEDGVRVAVGERGPSRAGARAVVHAAPAGGGLVHVVVLVHPVRA